MIDLNASVQKILDQSVLGALLIIALVAIGTLYKKVMDLEEARLKDSKEQNDTVTVALRAVSDKMSNEDTTLKSILITLEGQHDKS